MNNSEMIKKGKEIIKSIDSNDKLIRNFTNILNNHTFNAEFIDEVPSWLVCVLALKAVSNGNLGIGSIILDNSNNIITMASNEVFKPIFNSGRHAEMVAMDKFETMEKVNISMNDYKLYSSLESCPMCMTRLIISGIRYVFHVADDEIGGMVHLKKCLPDIWQKLSQNQKFESAKCSLKLKKLSFDIFLTNREELDSKILHRRGY